MKNSEPSLGRKTGLVIGSIILSALLILTLTLFSLAQLTTYETLKPLSANLAAETLTKNMTADEANTLYSNLTLACDVSGNESLILPMGENTTESVKIKCADIKSSGPTDLGKIFGGAIFDDLYYRNYGWSYPEAFLKAKSPNEYFSAFFSKNAHDFYNVMFMVLLALTVVMALVMIWLGKSWIAIARDFGISLILATTPFFVLELFKSNLPSTITNILGSTADMMTQSLSQNFLIIFAIGIVLLVIGLVGSRFSKKE